MQDRSCGPYMNEREGFQQHPYAQAEGENEIFCWSPPCLPVTSVGIANAAPLLPRLLAIFAEHPARRSRHSPRSLLERRPSPRRRLCSPRHPGYSSVNLLLLHRAAPWLLLYAPPWLLLCAPPVAGRRENTAIYVLAQGVAADPRPHAVAVGSCYSGFGRPFCGCAAQ
jgi:hypothetical protein